MLFARFQDWFAELWRGEKLAATVAVLTVGVTLAFRFVATHTDTAATDSDEDKPQPPGPA